MDPIHEFHGKEFLSQPKMRIQNKIIHGPQGEVIPDISVGQFILQNIRANLDCTIQVDLDTGKSYTYKDVFESSIKVAGILKAYGIGPEDRISIASENHNNFLPTMCGIFYVGAVFAPLNPAYTKREYRHILEIFKPKLIFVTHRTERIIAEIASSLSWPMKMIEMDDTALTGAIPTLKELFQKPENLVDPERFRAVPVPDRRKTMAVILCSSGTTGPPKGVALSHRNLLTYIHNLGRSSYFNIMRGDRILLFLPMFHGYAFGLMIMLIRPGGTAYIMRSFDIVTMMKSIEKFKITHLPVVPPILVLLSKHPMVTNHDFSSVRELVCGAAPLPMDVATEVKRRTKIKCIRNGYGMTELTVVSNISDKWVNDESVGNLLPDFLCKVVDTETGEALDAGEVGEICFKGEQVMMGYFGNPEATAQTIDKENWLHTGDLGYYNQQGLLYVTGRLKELIKYKGFQVSPSEIESLILSHPSVNDVAVVGKPDPISGELPMALVVRQPGSTVSAKEIIQFANGNLSPQKWLRGGVKFVEVIPKTASGKIVRQQLLNLVSKL